MFKVIFIDIDDTLLDFDAYVQQAMEQGFRHFGLKAYEPWMFGVFERINNALWDKIEKGTLDFDGLAKIRFQKIFDTLGIDFNGEEFEKYFRAKIWDSAVEVAGAKDMVRYLSDKYILCVASNGPYEQQLHRVEISGMARYFRHFFISEKLGVSKPEKAFFQKSLATLNAGRTDAILPQECVIIGDSLRSDIQGGQSAGMKTVWFNRRGVENHSAFTPDFEIHTLAQVKGIL